MVAQYKSWHTGAGMEWTGKEELLMGGGRGGRRWQSWRIVNDRRWAASCNFTLTWGWWNARSYLWKFAIWRSVGREGLLYQILLLSSFSRQVESDSLQPHGLHHSRLPWPSPSPRACSSSCPLKQWSHPTTSSSVALFSFCLQSFLASGSFPMSQLFTSGG